MSPRVPTTVAVALLCAGAAAADAPRPLSQEVARHARERYAETTIATLAEMVAFRTVRSEGVENAENPQFRALTAYLSEKAEELGLDFDDRGSVVLIGLGSSPSHLGVVTHADVQPADASRWQTDPFVLDRTSEPGRLVGRGTVDDKGPIAAALYAMKTLIDDDVRLERRIELIISYTEESDWEPFKRFLATYEPPEINIALDANYPVVTAEKGWGEIHVSLPPSAREPADGAPSLRSFAGGAFLSQVPEASRAVVARPTPEVEKALRDAAARDGDVKYTFTARDGELGIEAEGVSAHSMNPWDGVNAITHLAALLGHVDWPDGQAARMVRLVNDLVGTGDYAEKFGGLAYSHPFMGRLTLTLATLGPEGDDLVANLSLRRPVGRSREEVESAIEEAVRGWAARTGTAGVGLRQEITEPYYLEDAPHVPALLRVFRHYTGLDDAQPIAIGGGTNARLLPYGVSFGPAMPGEPYTGHTEHEFITRDQLVLTLEIYTAMLMELAGPSSR